MWANLVSLLIWDEGIVGVQVPSFRPYIAGRISIQLGLISLTPWGQYPLLHPIKISFINDVGWVEIPFSYLAGQPNGRAADFDSACIGSIPVPAANKVIDCTISKTKTRKKYFMVLQTNWYSHHPFTVEFESSILSSITIKFQKYVSWLDGFSDKEKVVGSNPTFWTK